MNKLHTALTILISIIGVVNGTIDYLDKEQIVQSSQYAMTSMVEIRYQEAVDQECGVLRSGVWKAVKGDEVINKRLDKAYLEAMK